MPDIPASPHQHLIFALTDLLTELQTDDSATVAKQDAIITELQAILADLQGTDHATETTLAAILADLQGDDNATNTTLLATNALLTTLNATDFSTETTLAAVLAELQGDDSATETTLAAILADLQGNDNATETTLAAVLAELVAANALISHSNATKLIKYEMADTDELRREVTLTDDYFGRAPDGTATSASGWHIIRHYKDATGEIIRTRFRLNGVWDDRATGWT